MRLLFSLLLLLSSFISVAENDLVIKGKVLTEDSLPIAGAVVSISGQKVVSDEKGQFEIIPRISDVYQVKLSHPSYYANIQTFSHYELTQSSDVLAITLVNKQQNRVMLAFGGDVMMGRRFYQPYFGDEVLINQQTKLADSKKVVEFIKPYMSLADYAMVNLETPIIEDEPSDKANKLVTFYSQPQLLEALSWAGVDYVSLGNNHTYDYLDAGINSTLKFLEQSGLDYSGAGIHEQSALQAHNEIINNQEFAILGYVGWQGGSNPTQTANNQHGGAAYGSMDNILQSVAKPVSEHKVTVVQYHGSQEYADEPTGVTEQRLKSSLDAGAALAIAHHPHVTQGLELYNGKLIAYSMGNFIFDQNFSATQHSFMLYVWLDNGKFHRAEIVPLYIKGYKPTPATGMHRYTVMKRLTALSKSRNTEITSSGGHGVITAKNRSNTNDDVKREQLMSLEFSNNEQAVPLYHFPWEKTLRKVHLPDNNVRYRLGTNLINGSDFESFATFNASERGWLFDRNNTSLNNFGASGQHSLAIELDKSQPSYLGMQSFRRVFNASSNMTLKAKFNTLNPIKINFYWQGRKNSQKLFDALENGIKHKIASVELQGQQGWQNVELAFNSPRIGYRSYRIIAEVISEHAEQSTVNIDDFALIEWQTAFSKTITPMQLSNLSKQASYLGVSSTISEPIILEF